MIEKYFYIFSLFFLLVDLQKTDAFSAGNDKTDGPSAVVLLPSAENYPHSSHCQLTLPKIQDLLHTPDQTGIADVLTNLVNQKIKHFKNGLDADLFNSTDINHPTGSAFQTPACDECAGEIKGCGSFTKISGSGGDRTNNSGTTYGELENAWLQGMWIHAYQYILAQMIAEMQQNRSINLSHFASAVPDVLSQIQSNQTIFQQMCENYPTAHFDLCPASSQKMNIEIKSAQNLVGNTALNSQNLQAVCYLQMANKATTSALTHLSYGELASRVQALMVPTISQVKNKINQYILIPAKNKALGSCSDIGCGVDVLNNAYTTTYRTQWHRIMREQFPNDLSQNSCH